MTDGPAAAAAAPARPSKRYGSEDFVDTTSMGGGEWTAVIGSAADNDCAVGFLPGDTRGEFAGRRGCARMPDATPAAPARAKCAA